MLNRARERESILECDYGCLYTERSAARVSSAKHSGIERCIKHGAILTWATWAYGMTIYEARKQRKIRRIPNAE